MHDRTTDTSTPEAVPGRWRQILLNRWLLASVGVVVLYALLGFLLTPWIVTRYVSNYAVEKLKRKASIAEVHVNPFLFTFEGKNFVLQEADDRPIIGFGRLFVDFELSSLFRWAWTFADIRIERPLLFIEIQHNGRLNFADLADSFPKSEGSPPTDRRPPRLLLHHIEVVDGSFTFSDRANLTPAAATFSPINIEFNEISTLPERKGPYTVKADLPGGGTVGWLGEISFDPIFSEGELSMTGFKIATAWKFAQDELNLAEPSGEMDFSTRYRFDYQERTPSLKLQDAKFALKGLLLTEKGKNNTLLALKAIEADGMHFDLQERELMVPNIVVRDGKVAASVDEKGLFDWQKLVVNQEPVDVKISVPDVSEPAGRPWQLKIEALNVENVELDYSDHSRATPLALVVGETNIVLKASAEVGTGPVKASVDSMRVKLNRVALSEAGEGIPLIALDTLSLDDGRIDIGDRAITLTRMEAIGGKTSLVRDKDGQIQLVALLNPGDKGLIKREVIEAGKKALAEGKPWSFRLDAFEVNGFQVALQDRTFVPDIVYNLKDVSASLKNLTNDKKTPIDFNTAFKLVQGGSASVSGQVAQTGDHADAHVKLMGLNIKPLNPAVTKFTMLALESGNISVSTRVKYRSTKSGPQLNADGSVSLDKLRLIEADTGERFLEWKVMSVNGMKFGLSPDRLQIEEVRLLEPGAKFVIFKDRSVNLAKVLRDQNAAITDTKPQTAQTPSPAVVSQENRVLFPVNIDRVRVEKGVVDFADLSLVLPFATRVTDFNGNVTGISSRSTSRASVKFDGRVDEYGLATVEGSLSPFIPKTFTDISVLFSNVEMKPLSPYSATFAGRKIASGKLSLNLEYKVQNSELLGENKVLLEQFTLGERVEAPDAIRLPLDLAIALLTDAEGKIDVAVPVSGNVDHPDFKYGRVIWQAFVKLITKVVTAPFRALGGLFGEKSQQMDAIAFDAGSARLLPPEQEKLKKISGALKKRPQLRLVVEGRFDPKADGEALRTERTRHALAKQMGVKLAPEEDLGPIVFDSVKTQKALEKLLEMRKGDTAIDDFKTQYEKATGKKAKRTNFAMAVIGWASSDTDFYQAIFKELIKLEPLTDNDLKELALRRAEAIVKELETTVGIGSNRVTSGSSGPVEKASTDTVNTKLTLDVIKPAA
jgi:outer membrane protein OmpA-like peptidoglycan-associated protein